MSWRAGFSHPLGLLMLSTSVVLAALAATGLSWRGQEGWLLGWGALTYVCIVAYVSWRMRLVVHTSVVVEAPAVLLVAPPEGDVQAPAPGDLARLVEDALQHLASPNSLVSSPLMTWFARTLAATWIESGKQRPPTPLEKAQLLRSVLEASVGRLKPTGGDGDSNQYHVLHEHYVQGHPIAFTISRHPISERTFHRIRVAAVQAVAADLAAQEASLTPT